VPHARLFPSNLRRSPAAAAAEAHTQAEYIPVPHFHHLVRPNLLLRSNHSSSPALRKSLLRENFAKLLLCWPSASTSIASGIWV
jgi:hypothetical protein